MGNFTKSQAERPLSSARLTRAVAGTGKTRGWQASRREMATGGGRGRTTSAMIRQKIRCTAIGCSQFELLASPVAVRQNLPDLLDTPRPLCFSLSHSVSLLCSLLFYSTRLVPFPRLLSLCRCRRRRRRLLHRLLRRASLAVGPPPRENGRRREGPKKLRKKNPISLLW